MCIVCALPYVPFWQDGSFHETFLHDNYTQSQRGTGDPNLTPYFDTPLSAATTSFLRSRGDVMSADQVFPGPANPEYAQHPPNCVIDYWFHRLGLPAEAPSNFPTLPSALPVFDDNDPSVRRSCHSTPRTIDSQGVRILYGWTADFQQAPPDQGDHKQPQPLDVVLHQPRVIPTEQRLKHRVYDSPGRNPGAEYEPDPIKLQASCQLRGGTEFACQWVLTAFKGGVTLEALVRRLKLTEIERINFPGGFKLSLAYDGFLQKADDGFECCLCPVDKKVRWKNKKDAIRHLRKFHFGLADQCDVWYVLEPTLMCLLVFPD